MQHQWDTSDGSEAQMTRVWQECEINDRIATRVKNFGFDAGTSQKTYFPSLYRYMAKERLQGEKQFINNKYYLLETSLSYAIILLKSAPQKLNLVMERAT